jgi:hypothetical protein
VLYVLKRGITFKKLRLLIRHRLTKGVEAIKKELKRRGRKIERIKRQNVAFLIVTFIVKAIARAL